MKGKILIKPNVVNKNNQQYTAKGLKTALKSWKEVTIRLEELHTREDDIKIQSVKEVKVWINPEEWRSIFSDLLMKNK